MEWQKSTIFWRSDEALIHIGYELYSPKLRQQDKNIIQLDKNLEPTSKRGTELPN